MKYTPRLLYSFIISCAFVCFPSFSRAETSPSTQNAQKHSTMLPAAQRCQKTQPWTDKNVAQWLHLPLKTIHQVQTLRHLSNHDICTMPESKLKRAIDKSLHPVKPDQPDKAMEFRMQQLSIKGIVKPDGMFKAFEKRKTIVSQTQRVLMQRYLQSHSPQNGTALPNNITSLQSSLTVSLSRENWIPLGPDNIGGRMRALFIHPANTDLLFAGSVGGGIWRSDDGGASWNAVNDFMANLAVTCIAADPRTTDKIDTTVLYASTGEGVYNIDSLRGYGIFKSTDGGRTWNHINATDPTQDSDWYYINRLAVNHNGTIVAVAKSNAVFTSTDGGDTWSKNEPGPNWYSMMYDVKFDPNDDNKAVVGSVNGKIYYTTDEGNNWNEVTIVDASISWISGRVEIAYAKSSSGTLYASVDRNSGELYRSDDGGVTWTYVSNPQHLGGQGWYANAIWVDPTDASHLVIAGLDIYQSTDGGNNWSQISTWWRSPDSPHADHHILISDPNYDGNNNKRLYNGNDGGLYKADDITATNDGAAPNGWTNLNNGLAITQFYGGAGISGSRIIGGAQDNGSLIQPEDNATAGWGETFGGDGGQSAVSHEVNAGTYYYFGEYVYLQVHRSDNGNQASYIYENGLDDAGNNNANFIAPFILDPNNDNTMIAGGASLWRSTNVSTVDEADVTWSKIKDALSNNYVSTIAVAEGDSDLILVGYNDGSIYKTTNGTSASPTWTKIYDTNNKNVLSLLIDKDDHTIFYAGWGGFASGNIQKTTDSGNSWNDISVGLPQVPVRSIVRHPTRADYLYIGTEVGIFTSEDQGSTWFATNNGPANVSVDHLFWYDTANLVAVTHGRGMFITKIELSPCEEVSRALKAYDWTLVSFPCNTGDNNISALLGKALGTYGDNANWIMYEQTGTDNYHAPNTQKRLMDANDTLIPGKGYWIITDANRTLQIDHTLPNLSFVNETNASDLQINNDNFLTVFQPQLPDSENAYAKNILLGNPFPVTIHLGNVYFSHNNAADNYNPMSDDDNTTTNPNAPFVKGTVYTTDENSTDTYRAISPDTPGFSNTIDPMCAFYLRIKSNQTGSNYIALPNEE